MGHRLTKSHYVLHFPCLGNNGTSRSVQAGYRFVLEIVFVSHNMFEHKLATISFPTVVSMNEWLLFPWLLWLPCFSFSMFRHVPSRSFVQGGCRNARRCAVAFCLRLWCVYMFQVDHPYESLYKMGGGRVQNKINKWNKWG